MDVRFLYSVNPKKPIKTIKGVPLLRTPRSLQLSKEEVRECLKYGSVYRRFANEGRNERVTINTVDRLHNAKFMTEEEYTAFLKANVDSKNGTVINDITPVTEPNKPTDEKKESAVVETTKDELIDETNKETSNTEESEEETVIENAERHNHYNRNRNYNGSRNNHKK